MAKGRKLINEEEVREYLEKENVDNVDTVIKNIEKELQQKVRSYKDKGNKYQKEYDESPSFFDVYPEYDLSVLPKWVKDGIETAHVIGNAKQTLLFDNGERYQLNNTLNHLSGGDWITFTKSVLNTKYATNGKDAMAHHIRKIHPTPKPPTLMKEIIEFFTKENEIVFDYFMGVGGSLLGAGLCGRRAVGIDLNATYIDAYRDAANYLNLPVFPAFHGDSLELIEDEDLMNSIFGGEKVSLLLLDPPYGNMMSREKTGADIQVYGNVSTPFTEDERDLGNKCLEDFFPLLKKSVESSMKYIKKRGHVVVFIKDLQPTKKSPNLLHADIINTLVEIPNLEYKGMRIWADQTAKLFPYGYPFTFVANQIHQFILIFRKEK